MKKKINHRIKSLSIELDKNTQLKELNGIIKNFKETTNDKYEVNVHITFTCLLGSAFAPSDTVHRVHIIRRILPGTLL